MSLTYVAINTVISVTVALPAAYAFNRYRFIGDKHLFFWLLSNLMAPPAVFAMPFFNLYYAVGLFDTVWAVALAHCLFNVPLAVWILEGFIAGVPREIDETAAIDGYSFPRFFIRIFLPLIANGIGVTAFFCFMFSWVEQLLATTLTTVNAKPFAARDDAQLFGGRHGLGRCWRPPGVLTMMPGRDRHLVRAQPHRQGLRPWAGLKATSDDARLDGLDLADRRRSSASSRCALIVLTLLAVYRPETPRTRHPRLSRPRAATASSCRCSARPSSSSSGCGSAASALWYPLAASVVYGIAMFRFA